jgi:hypothetical protein
MFTLSELKEDPTLLIDLKEDVREECELLGEVTNVTLYDVRTPSADYTFPPPFCNPLPLFLFLYLHNRQNLYTSALFVFFKKTPIPHSSQPERKRRMVN